MQKAQEKLRAAKAHETVVACENSPHNVTLSGKALNLLGKQFGKDGISCQHVSSCHGRRVLNYYSSLIQYCF